MFSITRLQRKIFYILLILVWSIVGIYSMFTDSFLHGLFIIGFGTAFILSVALIQTYMIRLLNMYDKNLIAQKQKLQNNKKRK